MELIFECYARVLYWTSRLFLFQNEDYFNTKIGKLYMRNKKYNLANAVRFCFQYAPRAASIKLLIEIINGALMPLMVLVVASFINNAVSFVNGDGNITSLVTALVLMAVYYAYSQANQIFSRIADKSLENALRENLRPQLIQKQARTSFHSVHYLNVDFPCQRKTNIACGVIYHFRVGGVSPSFAGGLYSPL